MPAGRTEKVLDVRERLLTRLRNGFYQPGDRFLSNRSVAELFGISYQTAHRLIAELCAEGVLERRPQSGTYVPGGVRPLVGVQIAFHSRAAKSHSFGAKLLAKLTERLAAERIDWKLDLVDEHVRPAADRLPVIWESPDTVARCAVQGQTAILINDRPRVGLESMFIDSVSTDDFSGGVCAAQLLESRTKTRQGFAVLAGSTHDTRSRMRVQGFLSSIAAAKVVEADSWFFDGGYAAASAAVEHASAGLFCCNDQLASAVIRWCQDHHRAVPALVGFDDAPIAETLNFTTIAIPWEELVDGVVRVAKRRLSGDRSASSQQIFNPRPVIRGEFADRM